MNRQRILVTGGAGFIGSHTVDLLLAQGKEIIVLDNLSSGRLTNLNMQHPDLEVIEGDILEYPLLVDLLRGVDAVLHLAAIASVPRSVEMPVYTSQVNTLGTLHILEAIRQAHRDIRLVYASSSAVYGNCTSLPCNENMQGLTPTSPYALQKWQSEEYAALYQRLFGIPSLGLRYFNVYGPRQDPSSPYSGVISLFMDAYREDREFTIYGDGQQSRDFIYVGDVAAVNVLSLMSNYSGVANIGTGRAQTLLDLVACIESVGKRPARYRLGDPRPGDIRHSYGAIDLAKTKLHFSAEVPLAEGIKFMMH